MEHALYLPAVRFDRRVLVRLLLAGATGAVLAEAGISVIGDAEGVANLDSLQRLVSNLAAAYDDAGPAKVAQYAGNLELQAATLLTGGSLATDAQMRDAKAAYSRLLTMSATAMNELGVFEKSAQAGKLAASLATEIGDREAEGRAWTVVAGAQRSMLRFRSAASTAKKAQRVAGVNPAAVGAHLQEARVAAADHDVATTFDAVIEAERVHARLPEREWGDPGYALDGYHPARLKAFAGWALADVGLYGEAAERLDEAEDIVTGIDGGSDSWMAYVWLGQARVLLGNGDVDGAHNMAAMAVAQEESRPAAWVPSILRRMDRHARGHRHAGPFVDLIDQTRGWGS